MIIFRNATKLHKNCGGKAKPDSYNNYVCKKCNEILELKDMNIFLKNRHRNMKKIKYKTKIMKNRKYMLKQLSFRIEKKRKVYI